tara:strand:- start:18 stop:239 length:222 start_codon:yes stop_codon:yes gene_type:complete
MEKKKLNRIIEILREEMMTANAPGTQGGFSSSAPAKGPRAGFDPLLGKMQRRKKKYIKLPAGSRKRWMKKDES